MSPWAPAPLPHGPRARALQDAIAADIRAGRLVPGASLPGARALAATLELSRGTVVRAYDELEAEGWLEIRPGCRPRVRCDLPAASSDPAAPPRALGFPLGPGPGLPEPRPDVPYALLGGHPDLRLLPLAELARAYGRVLRRRGRHLMGYGDPAGEPRLIQALGDWLATTRGVRPAPGGLLVTRGSQMALDLVARALLKPGDVVAVERYGYPPAWDALEASGARLVSVPVDEGGLVVDALPDGARAVYLTPHHQYPTGATLEAGRRLRLLAWARRQRVAVLEDDYDHEYHYEGAPVRPLVATDEAGVVVSLGTLSKAFAPGLRLGWVVAPPPLIERLVALRLRIDRQGDRVVAHAVSELLADGTLVRHLRRTRRVYAARRRALLQALASELPELSPAIRPGGLALWCHAPGIDVDAWAEDAVSLGVWFETAARYARDGQPRPWVRLGFAGHDEGELREAVRRMRLALSRVR